MSALSSFSYLDVSNMVYGLGRQQGLSDSYPDSPVVGGLMSDFSNGTYENLANRIIVDWTSENSIDSGWQTRDENSLRDMYNIGRCHSIEKWTEQ